MSAIPEQLRALMLPIEGEETEVAAKARDKFQDLYCAGNLRGEVPLHHGGKVVFFADRFDHAFYSSPNRARNPYSKTKLALDRIERMEWIGALIRGEVPGTECWEVIPQSGRQHPRDRALILWQPGYIIWLWPTQTDGCFKFSSAYPVPSAELARYTRGGRKIWRVEKIDAP